MAPVNCEAHLVIELPRSCIRCLYSQVHGLDIPCLRGCQQTWRKRCAFFHALVVWYAVVPRYAAVLCSISYCVMQRNLYSALVLCCAMVLRYVVVLRYTVVLCSAHLSPSSFRGPSVDAPPPRIC
jgi:hypothetical protein